MSLFGKKRRRHTNANSTGTASRRRRRNGGPLKIIAAVGAVLALVLAVGFGVSAVKKTVEAGKVDDTIKELSYALGNMDADSLLDIIDPAVADPLRMIAALSGSNKNQIMGEVMASMSDPDSGMDLTQMTEAFTYKVLDRQIDGEYAAVLTDCTMDVNGTEFARYVTFYLQNIRGKWYIMDMDISVTG